MAPAIRSNIIFRNTKREDIVRFKFIKMKNSFTEYLIKNGWIEVSFLTYQFQENKSVELFFNTSNQVELHINKKRTSEKHLKSIEDLVSFLSDNKLI